MKEILEKNGLKVAAEAKDGLEAVHKYKEHNPDYTFLDITMDNMNGVEALKEIIAYNPKAVVVMCSALGQKALIVECIKIGAKDFIIKPFDENRIKLTLENLSKS